MFSVSSNEGLYDVHLVIDSTSRWICGMYDCTTVMLPLSLKKNLDLLFFFLEAGKLHPETSDT